MTLMEFLKRVIAVAHRGESGDNASDFKQGCEKDHDMRNLSERMIRVEYEMDALRHRQK